MTSRLTRGGGIWRCPRPEMPGILPNTPVWVGLNPSRSDDTGTNRSTLRTVLRWATREDRSEGSTSTCTPTAHRTRRDQGPPEARLLETLIGIGNNHLLRHLAAQADHAQLDWGKDGVSAAGDGRWRPCSHRGVYRALPEW